MAEYLVSPGIQITETDKSAIGVRPMVAGAALIGPTPKGPVNVPVKVTSYGDYMRRFGTTFTYIKDGIKNEQEYLTSLAAKSYFEQGGDSLLVTRVAATDEEHKFGAAHSTNIKAQGLNAVKTVEKIIRTDIKPEGPEETEVTDYRVVERDVRGNIKVIAVPADSDKEYEIGRNYTDEETGYEFNFEVVVETVEDEDIRAKFIGVAGNTFELHTISQGKELNNVTAADYTDEAERADGSLKLGAKENIRFEIVNVNLDAGTFGLVIRRGDDTAYDKTILETYAALSLDPNSPNYIAKVIGDQHCEIGYDDEGRPFIDVIGDYTNKSAYVYVNVLKPTLNYFLADGYTVNVDADNVPYSYYLPQEQNGGFYGGTGVNNPEGDWYEEIKAESELIQGVKPADYIDAVDLLYNTDEYEINIVSVPGMVGNEVTDRVVSLAADRGDCIAVVDLSYAEDSAKKAAENASKVNSSYAATYYPWLQMYNSVGRLVWVPASVVIPGVYVYNDHAAAPWFAPAGMVRGGIQGVVQTKRKLTKAHRDTLYAKNVNPIGTFPGAGIVIYGQKTLQKKASALDRVNARRLLIELKKKIKDMAAGLLFEQNSAATRNSFRAKVEPYLESVVQRQGLYSYKVVIDELNDADTIDRNEFRCAIYLQPSKVIEYIYIDFTITATGVEFNN